MKYRLVGLIAVAAMCPAFPVEVQAQINTCFFPAMRLMNQNTVYARKGPTVQTMVDGEMYFPSDVNCVPMVVTTIVRAVIENSKDRFTSFKSSSTFTSRFKNLPPPIPTGNTGTAAARLLPDFWDVSFVNEMIGRMDTGAAGTTTSDNNFTKGTGIGLQDIKNDITTAADPNIGISYREANATNLDFRPVSSQTIADKIQQGIGVALVLLPIEGHYDPDGTIAYEINPASHAVAVKGWTRNAGAAGGFIFKVHDPSGPVASQVPPSMPALTRSLGLVRSLQFLQSPTPFKGVFLALPGGQTRNFQSTDATWVMPNPNLGCSKFGNPCYILGGVITFSLKDSSGIQCSTQAFDPEPDTLQLVIDSSLQSIKKKVAATHKRQKTTPSASTDDDGTTPIRVPQKH